MNWWNQWEVRSWGHLLWPRATLTRTSSRIFVEPASNFEASKGWILREMILQQSYMQRLSVKQYVNVHILQAYKQVCRRIFHLLPTYIYTYDICVFYTLFCSFLCLADHWKLPISSHSPPPPGQKPDEVHPRKASGNRGETGWMRMSPLTHLAAPAESMSCPSTVIWAKSWCKQNMRED